MYVSCDVFFYRLNVTLVDRSCSYQLPIHITLTTSTASEVRAFFLRISFDSFPNLDSLTFSAVFYLESYFQF